MQPTPGIVLEFYLVPASSGAMPHPKEDLWGGALQGGFLHFLFLSPFFSSAPWPSMHNNGMKELSGTPWLDLALDIYGGAIWFHCALVLNSWLCTIIFSIA